MEKTIDYINKRITALEKFDDKKTINDFGKGQLFAFKEIHKQLLLLSVVKSLPNYNDALNKLGARLFEEDIEYVKFIKDEKQTGFFTGFLECYKWLTD